MAQSMNVELGDIIAEQVKKTPDSVAVVYDGMEEKCSVQITYCEMWHRASQILEELQCLGVEKETIGVCVEPGINVPSILLGILRASSSYFPFGVDGCGFVKQSLHKLGIRYLLLDATTLQAVEPLLTELSGKVVPTQSLHCLGLYVTHIDTGQGTGGQLKRVCGLAYCITTSGTTGMPKVVRVPHTCIVPNVLDFRKEFQPQVGDVTFLTSPLTFDPSVIDIFMTLSSGATLLLVPTLVKMSGDLLLTMLTSRHQVSILQITPSLFGRMDAECVRDTLLSANSPLRVLAFGGEKFPGSSVFDACLHPDNGTHIYNIYGITELSCWATLHHARHPARCVTEPVPVGEALTGTRVKVVDDDGVELRHGVGHIWIGGSHRLCLLGEEDDQVLCSGCVWRNTGDMGSVHHDGAVYCLGRTDRQIKRHGKRLDLDTLEKVCGQVTTVAKCCAVHEGEKLHVFFTTQDQEEKDKAALCDHVRSHVVNTLPSQYHPDNVMWVPAFPVNSHGKLDVTGLSQLSTSQTEKYKSSSAMSVEAWSCSLWQEVLGDRQRAISSTDSFLACGGDSLKAVYIVEQVEQHLGHDIPDLVDMVLTRTFADFVFAVQQQWEAGGLAVRTGDGKHHRTGQGSSKHGVGRYWDLSEPPVKMKRKDSCSWFQDSEVRTHEHNSSDTVSSSSTHSNVRQVATVSNTHSNVRQVATVSNTHSNVRQVATVSNTHSNVRQVATVSNTHSNVRQVATVSNTHSNVRQVATVSNTHSNVRQVATVSNTHSNVRQVATVSNTHSNVRQVATVSNTHSNVRQVATVSNTHSNVRQVANVDTTRTDNHSLTDIPSTANVDMTRTDIHSLTDIPSTANVDTTRTNIHSLTDIPRTDIHSLTDIPSTANVDTTRTDIHSLTDIPSTANVDTTRTDIHSLTDIPSTANVDTTRTDIHSLTDITSTVSVDTTRTDIHSLTDIPGTASVDVMRADMYVSSISRANRSWLSNDHSRKFCSLSVVANGNVRQGDGALCSCRSREVSDVSSVPLELQWTFDTGKCVDASPLVATTRKGRAVVFIGSHSHQFSALDLDSGTVLWSVTLGDRVESSACLSPCGAWVVVGCYDHKIYVLRTETGELQYQVKTGDVVKCSPVSDARCGVVLCGSHDGFLYALNCQEGRVVWKTWQGGGGVFASPVVCTRTAMVYTATLRGHINALSVDSGRVVWRVSLNKPVFSSPAVHGGHLYVGCVDSALYCLSCTDGLQVWAYTTQAPIFSSPVVMTTSSDLNPSVLFGSHDNHLYCISNAGQLVWRHTTPSTVYASPFVFSLCHTHRHTHHADGHLSLHCAGQAEVQSMGCHTHRQDNVNQSEESASSKRVDCVCGLNTDPTVPNTEPEVGGSERSLRPVIDSVQSGNDKHLYPVIDSVQSGNDEHLYPVIDSVQSGNDEHLYPVIDSVQSGNDKHLYPVIDSVQSGNDKHLYPVIDSVQSGNDEHLYPVIDSVQSGNDEHLYPVIDSVQSGNDEHLYPDFDGIHNVPLSRGGLKNGKTEHRPGYGRTKCTRETSTTKDTQKDRHVKSPGCRHTGSEALSTLQAKGDESCQQFVACASTKGVLSIVNCVTGKLIGQETLPGELFSSPVVAGDRLVIGCRDDMVYCYKLQCHTGSCCDWLSRQQGVLL